MYSSNIFFKNYTATSDRAERENLMKDFLFSLSPDELIDWLKDSNKIIKDNLAQLINSGDSANIQFAKECLDEMEAFLQPKTIKKAA